MGRAFPEFGYNPVTGEWNDSLAGTFLWSNVNVSEAVPDVMTPSTWSLWWIYHYEASPFEFPGEYAFCGNICGRPYLNLSLISSLYRAFHRDVRKELQADMIGSVPADLDVPVIQFSPLALLPKVLPGLLKARRDASRNCKHVPEFLANIPGWCRDTRSQLQTVPDAAALLVMWTESIRPAVVRGCEMLRAAALMLADPGTRLRQDLTALIGETDANALLSSFSGHADELESLGPLVGLARVQDGSLSREQYLERYGHRGPHEMELSVPDPGDDPDWLEKQLASFNQSRVDVWALLAKQRTEYASAWQRFEARFPDRVSSMRRRLDIVAAAAQDREAVRSEMTRIARLVRQFLLRVGEVTGLGDGVFFLSLDEITATLAGARSPASRILARRDTYRRYSALPPYPAIISGRFDPFRWAADPNRRSDFYDARQTGAAIPSPAIRGFAGAAGCVEGLVRRLDRAEDGYQAQPGEILVTSITNIGWTPLFPRLAAIVTDVGAPLSHAAIVARELGIPAVVGCGNATMLLKTGDRVRVDGGRGTVEVLPR
jgi:rifampicin phosphotransferase